MFVSHRICVTARDDGCSRPLTETAASFQLSRLPRCDRWQIGVAFDGLFAHMFAAVEQKYRESDSD